MPPDNIKTSYGGFSERVKWVWPAMAVVLPLLLFCACLLDKSLWIKFGMQPMDPTYADTQAILSSVDARAAGADPYSRPNPYDPFGRPHVYGPWWLELHRLGISSADRAWIGTLLLLTSIGVMVWLCRPRCFTEMLAAALLVASPPLILAYERGNNDLVIFLMLAAAGYILSGVASWRTAATAFIIWFAAALKLYPLAAAPVLLAKGGRYRGWIAVIGVGAAFGVVRLVYNEDFVRAFAEMPKPDSSTAYGFRVLGLIWHTPGMLHEWFCGGLAAGIAGWAFVGWRSIRDKLCLSYLDYYWVGGAACWVLCYFVNTNYAYRAALLVLPVSVWMRQAFTKTAPGRSPAAWAFVLSIILFWIRVRHPSMEAISTQNGLRLAAATLGIENGLALGLTLYLTWSGFRWVLLRWRAGEGGAPA